MAYIDNVTNILQIQPDGLPTFVRLSQNENGRNLYFQLAGNEIDIPTNATITISGTKPDGTVYSGTGSISDNVILIPEMIQMTAVAGYYEVVYQVKPFGLTYLEEVYDTNWQSYDGDATAGLFGYNIEAVKIQLEEC